MAIATGRALVIATQRREPWSPDNARLAIQHEVVLVRYSPNVTFPFGCTRLNPGLIDYVKNAVDIQILRAHNIFKDRT